MNFCEPWCIRIRMLNQKGFNHIVQQTAALVAVVLFCLLHELDNLSPWQRQETLHLFQKYVKQGARLLLHSTTKTNQGKAKAQPRFHGLILIKFTSACMDCRRPIQAFFLLKSRTFGLTLRCLINEWARLAVAMFSSQL